MVTVSEVVEILRRQFPTGVSCFENFRGPIKLRRYAIGHRELTRRAETLVIWGQSDESWEAAIAEAMANRTADTPEIVDIPTK